MPVPSTTTSSLFAERHSTQSLRVGLLLWLAGLPGVLSLVWVAEPEWLMALAVPDDTGAVRWAATAVLSALLALAIWLGGKLGPQVGLGAPLITATVQGRTPWRGIRFLSLPGVAGGVVGAAWLVTLAMLWPENLSVVDPVYSLPLWHKMLYGGLTEELLLRYGVMSVVMWLLWKTFGDARRRPGWQLGWWAVIITAVLTGIFPVYLAWSFSGHISVAVLAQLLVCEIMYGLLAGMLFWRYGLESAMLAHSLTYLLSHGLV